jgi:hypothetical protein
MKKTRIITTAILLGTVISSNASANFDNVSGASLKRICTSFLDVPANMSDGMCIGYVVGIMSVMDYMNVLCMPEKSSHAQATLVVQKYLSDHPEKLHANAEELVFDALHEAFPCTDGPPEKPAS